MIDHGCKGLPPSRRVLLSLAPGSWSVATKLLLAFGALVSVLVVSAVVSYRSIQQIESNLYRVVDWKEPLERAVLEMEISAGEAARAVLDYIHDLEPENLEVMRDADADFQRFAARFERLAETAEERRLGREVATLYAGFTALGDEIVALADERHAFLRIIRKAVNEIDEIIDEKLQKAIDMTVPDGMKKLHIAYEMEINIDKAFAAIEGYVLHPDAALRAEAADAERDFERFVASYREASLSGEENRWLDQISADFDSAVIAGGRVMALADTLSTRLDDLEEHLVELDAILDDRIQPLIRAETRKASRNAKTSTDRATLLHLVLGAVAAFVALASARAVSREIVGPLRALTSGAEIIGRGSLGHRIDIRSKDEFGRLAAAFNYMVDKLARERHTIEYGRAQLAHKVNERTAELRQSEARFRNFAEAASDWFWEMDAELRFTFVSAHFFREFRLRPYSVIGKTGNELAGKAEIAADPEKWRRHFDDLEAHRPIRDFSYAIVGDDGQRRHLSLSGVPLFDDAGNFKGYRGSDTDVTARVRAEEALIESERAQKERVAELESTQRRLERQRNAKQELELTTRVLDAHRDQLEKALKKEQQYNLLQREFVSMASHEFRTPLAIIDGAAQRLVRQKDRLTPEKLSQRVKKIRHAVSRMTGLIESTLSAARLEAGTIEMNPEPCDVTAVLSEVIEQQQRLAKSHTISLVLDDLPRTIFADPKLLDQVFTNLLSNAVKYSPGDTDIEVRGWTERGQVVFTIRDHGVGIPAGDFPRLFQRYFRAKTSTGIAGTGIGLNLAKQLVELHHGSIEVESVEGEGSTFTVRLPIDFRNGASEALVASEDWTASHGAAAMAEAT